MSPVAEGEVVFDCLCKTGEDDIDDVRAKRILDENDGSHEGRFQRLLDGQLQCEVDKGVAKLLILVIVAQHAGDGLHLGRPLAQGGVSET